MPRRTLVFLTLAAIAFSFALATAAQGHPSGSAMLLIRHQTAHCHAWSLDGGPFKAAQAVTLGTGSTLAVVNQDVMPHRLIQLSGPATKMWNGTTMPMMRGSVSGMRGLMSHMGARTDVRFVHPGVYRFRTRPGEDYFPGVKTTGADNVLTLTITVG